VRLYDDTHPAVLCSDASESECVRLALRDFARDLETVSGGHAPSLRPLDAAGAHTIVIGAVANAAVRQAVEAHGVDLSVLPDAPEHFLLETKDEILFLLGRDERGTMWAIYECSRRILGVHPLYRFTERAPRVRKSLFIDDLRLADGPQTYRFRGWFINDEDLIAGFCRQGTPEPDYDFHRDYLPLLSVIVETALRLKQNLLIPCSHLDMDNPCHEALVDFVTRRGICISMHHQEPVGVNQQRLDKWYAARGDRTENINYVDHPEKYREIWRHFIRKWAKYPNVIWQLGLRGRGDRPLWYQNDRAPDTVEGRGALISRALQEQWNLIAEETGTTDFLCSTTLWMEGMPLYEAGALRFPPHTMVILSDFGPDQMWDEAYYRAPRLPGTAYGGYYHVCFWGCGPHLVQGNRPAKILYNLRKAAEFGDTAYSILNVSNLREHLLGIDCVARATWRLDGLTEDGLIREWCADVYGTTTPAPLYRAYFGAFPSLDDRRVPGRMLLMDGMCKRVGMMLSRILAGGELTAPDIQNRRLFDFPDTDRFIAFYRTAADAGVERFEALLADERALLPALPPEARPLFENNLILQTETILGLYRWVSALAQAAEAVRAGHTADSALSRAAAALRRIPEVRARVLSPAWKHWYDGDTLIHITDLIDQTERMRARIHS